MRKVLVSLLMLLMVSACATSGRVYNRDASDTFVIGVTTANEAINSLGEPDTDIVRSVDGVRVLRWSYRKLRGIAVYEYVLAANFDQSGKLVYLHNPTGGQIIDPF